LVASKPALLAGGKPMPKIVFSSSLDHVDHNARLAQHLQQRAKAVRHDCQRADAGRV
jgi:hypothetical protein